MYIYICPSVLPSVRLYVCMFVRPSIHLSTLSVCMYVCLSVCLFTHTHTNTHTHTHRKSDKDFKLILFNFTSKQDCIVNCITTFHYNQFISVLKSRDQLKKQQQKIPLLFFFKFKSDFKKQHCTTFSFITQTESPVFVLYLLENCNRDDIITTNNECTLYVQCHFKYCLLFFVSIKCKRIPGA